MSKKFDVITIGGATRDVFFETDEGKILKDGWRRFLAFEYGSKIVPKGAYFSYGGGGMNAAVSFARLGLKVAAKINIGREGTGSLIHKILRSKKVNTSLVERDKKDHTALSIIITDNSDHTMFLYRGANDNLKIRNWSDLKNTAWFYVSSLTGDSEKILDKLPEFLLKNKIKLAWNPGSVQLEKGYKFMSKLLKVTDILILNQAEAEELFYSKKKKREIDISILLSEMKKLGPKIVVITKGDKGSYVTSGNRNYFQKSLSTRVIETTGAGDAYGSTFTAGIILGYDIPQAMEIAAKNAASVVSKIGAQEGLMTLRELKIKK